MRRWRVAWLLVAISPALIAACRSSPETQLRKIQQELASWEATERLTSELAQGGALPRSYVRQVEEAVAQGKDKARQQAAKISR
jgi:hypothetical protein